MDTFDVQVTVTRGKVGAATRDRARARVTKAMRVAPAPVLHARVILAVDPDPAVARPARMGAALDVGGRLILCRATAATADQAIALLERRLRGRFRKLTGRRTARRRAGHDRRSAGRWSRGRGGSGRQGGSG
jgi:hypothetical protein